MKVTEFVAEMIDIAKRNPEAEVLVEGWPFSIEVLPAYYDGPCVKYDPNTHVLKFKRTGDKVVLRKWDLEDLVDTFTDVTLDTSELPEWDAKMYIDRVAKIKKLSQTKTA